MQNYVVCLLAFCRLTRTFDSLKILEVGGGGGGPQFLHLLYPVMRRHHSNRLEQAASPGGYEKMPWQNSRDFRGLAMLSSVALAPSFPFSPSTETTTITILIILLLFMLYLCLHAFGH